MIIHREFKIKFNVFLFCHGKNYTFTLLIKKNERLRKLFSQSGKRIYTSDHIFKKFLLQARLNFDFNED